MDRESEVQRRSPLGQGLEVALGGEDVDLGGKEVELDGIEEVYGVGLRVVEYLLDGLEPLVQFALFLAHLAGAAFLVFPVGGKALLGYLVHAAAAYLHFDPLPLAAHERHVERLVAVGLGMAHPVAEAVGVWLVEAREQGVDLEADVHLVLPLLRLEDDPHGHQVVDLLEGHVLRLHLVPDGVDRLHAVLDFVAQPLPVQGPAYGGREAHEGLLPPRGAGPQLGGYGLVGLGVLILEAQVLQLGLYLVQPQAVGQGGIDVERLARHLILFRGGERAQRAHVVQAVGHFYEYDAYVVVHRQEQLLEVFGLRRSLVAEDAPGDLRQPAHELGNLGAEDVPYVLHRVVRVLHHVVQQGGADGGGAQPDLRADDAPHGYGVQDVGLAAGALDAAVGLVGKVEGLGYDFHPLAVVAGQVFLQQPVETAADQQVFLPARLGLRGGFGMCVHLPVLPCFC